MRAARQWLYRTAGGLPRAFWILWTGTLVNKVGSFVVLFLSIYLTTARGFSPAYAGLVLGAYGAGGALGAVAGGVLADRWGRRPTLVTAQLGAAALMLALGAVTDRAAIVAVAFLLGTFTEGVRPAVGALMVDVVPERDRLRAFNLNYWAINLGFALAAALAGLAARADFALLFVVDAATTVAMAVLVAVGLRGTPRLPAAAAAAPRRGGVRAVLRDRVFGVFLLGNLLLAIVVMQHMSTLPVAMGHDGLGPATFGWVIAVNGVLIVAGQLFVPRLLGRRDHSAVLAAAGLVTGVGFALTAFADTAGVYAATVLVWTVGEMINVPAANTLVAGLAPDSMRGRYQGMWSLSWQVASFSAPILGGWVQQHGGDTVLWLGCGGIGVAIAALHLAAAPARRRRMAIAASLAGALPTASGASGPLPAEPMPGEPMPAAAGEPPPGTPARAR
ncbi:MFS transporter [Pilimelia anulata]|uniref:MFS transporter n=1 Tax=Pilimelia anulata TaxID=53371 RepID=A0A8J3F7X4_9ACTN|nr:MFS transporter [Pilimelia anulata]GGJ91431.1 MFS transporter [Pilimelia anulata]